MSLPVHMAKYHKFFHGWTLWCGALFEGSDAEHIDTRWTENPQEVTCTECLAELVIAEAEFTAELGGAP